jgi:hypothetical protein
MFRRTFFPKCGPLVGVAAVLIGILLQAGCSAPHKQTVAAPAPAPHRAPSPGMTRSLPPAVPTQSALQVPAPQPAAQAEQPRVQESAASSVRKLLPKTCVVMEVSSTTVLVKPGTPTPAPSLFEEAIALSKLRGLLTARPAIPKDTAQKTRLQNGTATIPFGKSVPPADVASAVAAALSVDGVQRVRAVMGAD